MPASISRLRRWFAVGAITLSLLVAGMYFYARHRVQNALKQIPEKIGLDIEQTSQGFTVSKSDQGRTLFKIQASKAVQLKQGGRAELHDVTITLYGRDSGRFDQIYGQTFDFDPASGNVVGKGQVEMDLQANPAGSGNPDQAPPKDLRNPLHIETSDLSFNQKTGDAYTHGKVDFRVPQATGSAMGATYVARTNVLSMQSQVHLVLTGRTAATITATSAVIAKNPHWVILEKPHLSIKDGTQWAEADKATLFLRSDNSLGHILAVGNVHMGSAGAQSVRGQSDQLELIMAAKTKAKGDTVQTATLTGNVQMNLAGPQPMQANSGIAVLEFSGQNVLNSVHTEQSVKLVQDQRSSGNPASPNAQQVELTSPVVDFFVAEGRRLDHAETNGPPQIVINAVPPNTSGQQTVITAAKFESRFDDLGQIATVHGASNARIVTSTPGQPTRVSTSDIVDAAFQPGSGIETIVQQGSVAYVDGERKAWADQARYTPADQMLVLTGSPRVIDGGTTTTARTMRLNRATSDAIAGGDVRSTYNDLQPQPNGALLASSSPIHVTSQSMTAHGSSSVALYTGNARLWQDDNLVAAPSIQFDRDRRYVVAQGTPRQNVSTVLVQTDEKGKVTPINVTSARLTYADSERKAHFEEDVLAQGADMTITAKEMDAFFQPRQQAASAQSPSRHTSSKQSEAGSAHLDHIVARREVVITQANRRGTGDSLLYTAAEGSFVLTGGPPSIFDAEHGKITGVSLTFYKRDDRVLVEGNNLSPTVTHTRVAR
jgi:lipopolysaccharide export system protein LptA